MKSFLKSAAFITVFCVITTSFRSPIAGKDEYYIIVEKHKYELAVFDTDDTWLITYPVVFGNKDLGDKMVQGDRKTPEGTFHIISKRPHPKWDRFLALDYPNKESYEKFQQRKLLGIIPANAEIGGGIGIHGTWPHEEFAVDQYQNWTQGCVSTKNVYIQQLFNIIPLGTKVIILR